MSSQDDGGAPGLDERRSTQVRTTLSEDAATGVSRVCPLPSVTTTYQSHTLDLRWKVGMRGTDTLKPVH